MQISRAQNRVQSWVLFVRNLSRERLQSVVHSVCGHKAITARKLLTPLDYVMPFKKLHRFQITCWAYLGCSWEPQKKILTFICATPEPPVSNAGFILSVGVMKEKSKGVLLPLPGQHCKKCPTQHAI